MHHPIPTISLVIFSVLLVDGTGASGSLILARDGTSDYHLLVTGNADAQTLAAAEELSLHLMRITGAVFPIAPAETVLPEKEVHIGMNRHVPTLLKEVETDLLGKEGFRITSTGSHLVILGDGELGVLNAIWDFLERELNCRWFTPTLSVIPHHPTLIIDDIDRRYTPPFEVRTLWAHNTEHEGVTWPDRMRLNCFVRHIRDWDRHIHHLLLDGS